ncbi:hypothetical protein HDU79_004499 [Rhizoclosmatium sp. JEL0117]|nr:hypothetical protein HDU79_004499 [Rhizoclosmatium sp. JEL0117]
MSITTSRHQFSSLEQSVSRLEDLLDSLDVKDNDADKRSARGSQQSSRRSHRSLSQGRLSDAFVGSVGDLTFGQLMETNKTLCGYLEKLSTSHFNEPVWKQRFVVLTITPLASPHLHIFRSNTDMSAFPTAIIPLDLVHWPTFSYELQAYTLNIQPSTNPRAKQVIFKHTSREVLDLWANEINKSVEHVNRDSGAESVLSVPPSPRLRQDSGVGSGFGRSNSCGSGVGGSGGVSEERVAVMREMRDAYLRERQGITGDDMEFRRRVYLAGRSEEVKRERRRREEEEGLRVQRWKEEEERRAVQSGIKKALGMSFGISI